MNKMNVTVVLSGVPYDVSLNELGYNFIIMFDSHEVGTFRLREIDGNSPKRLVALDFNNGFDAMAVQDILDDFDYTLHNGKVTKLKARVSTNPKHLLETPIEEAQVAIPHTDGIGIIYSSESSNRKFVESNLMKTSTFDDLMKQHRNAKEKRHLFKVKRKSDREYQKLGDDYENEILKHSKRYTSESSPYEPRRSRSKSNDWPNDTIGSPCSYKRSTSKYLSTSRRSMYSNREYEARQLSSKVERPCNYRNYRDCDVLYSSISSNTSHLKYKDRHHEDTIKNYENSNILQQKIEEAVQDVLFEINCSVENDKKLLQKSDLTIVTQFFEMYVRSGFKKLNLHKEMLVNEMVMCYRRQRSKTEDTAFYQKLINELKVMDYCDEKLKEGGLSDKTSKAKKKKEQSQDIWDTVDEVLEEFPMDLLQDYEIDEIPNRVPDDVNNKEVSCTQKRDYNEDLNPETSKPCKATAEENIKENSKDRNILDVIEISDDENVTEYHTMSKNIVHSNKGLVNVEKIFNTNFVANKLQKHK